MGYDARQTDQCFTIKKEKINKAYEALRVYVRKRCHDFDDILDEEGWESCSDDYGNIVKIYFCADNWNNNKFDFMKELAPYVEPDSYIQFSCNEGEDLWRLVFDGETCKYVYPKIIWE